MSVSTFDITKIRNDFPILNQTINSQTLTYLDSGATTQKPQCVIDTTAQFYAAQNANVHRGRHTLSEQATYRYEQVRDKAENFLVLIVMKLYGLKGQLKL